MSFLRRTSRTREQRTDVGPQQAADLVEHGAILLDVREPYEWAAGHAPTARHIPLDQLPTRLDALPSGQPIVVVCRSGNRSARAVSVLTGAGRDAHNLTGGMVGWHRAGLPVVTDSAQPGQVL